MLVDPESSNQGLEEDPELEVVDSNYLLPSRRNRREPLWMKDYVRDF